MVTDDIQTWPKVGFEERLWVPENTMLSRTQKRLHTGPYKAALIPEISELTPTQIPADTTTLLEDATAEIARFDEQANSTLAPFEALILRSESASSSQIENLTSSAKSVALAELGDTSNRNANVIANNAVAMKLAITDCQSLTRGKILDIHQALLGDSEPEIAGKFRTQQNWIGGSNAGPHRANFVPPHPDNLAPAIDDLVAFMKRDDLTILTQVAIAHAQFETIHPFVDGNGRTGRALMHSMLSQKGLTTKSVVPISAGLLVGVQRYFDALNQYRQGNIEPLLNTVAESALSAITNSRKLLAEVEQVRNQWDTQLKARSDSSAQKLLDILCKHPIISGPLAEQELNITTSNALRAINRLTESGIVKEITGGQKRNRRWAAHQILAALDAFAERSGRRTNP